MIPLFAGLVASVAAAPMSKRDVDPSLIPSLGFSAGVNPTGMFPRIIYRDGGVDCVL